jgi:hypothetical protein
MMTLYNLVHINSVLKAEAAGSFAKNYKLLNVTAGPGSSVGIATGYELVGPGIE